MLWPVNRGLLGLVFLCGCADNRAPVFDPPLADRSVTVGQTISFDVRAIDRDGDEVRYGARGLPVGSIFDRDASPPVFRWTPLASDADADGRLHPIVFIAEDENGARLEERLVVVVYLGESRPRFTSPGAHVLDLRLGPTLDVVVTVRDDDSTQIDFELVEAPAGVELTPLRKEARLRWTPTAAQLAARRVFGITVGAMDERGTDRTE